MSMAPAIRKTKKSRSTDPSPQTPPLFPEPVDTMEDLDASKQIAIEKLQSRPGFRYSIPALPQTRTIKGQILEDVAASLGTGSETLQLIRKLFDTKEPAVRKVMAARAAFVTGMDRWGYRCSFSPGGRFLMVQNISAMYLHMGHVRAVPPEVVHLFDQLKINKQMAVPDAVREFIRDVESGGFPHYARILRAIAENREVSDEEALLFLQDEFDRLNCELQAVVDHFNRYEYGAVLAKRREEMKAVFTAGDYPTAIRFAPTFRIVSLSVKDKFTDNRLMSLVQKQLLDDYVQAVDTIVADILSVLDDRLEYLKTQLRTESAKSGLPHRFNPNTFRDVSETFRREVEKLGIELGFSDRRLEDLLQQVDAKIGRVTTSTINVLPSQKELFDSNSARLRDGVLARRETLAQAVGSIQEQLSTCLVAVAPRRISRAKD